MDRKHQVEDGNTIKSTEVLRNEDISQHHVQTDTETEAVFALYEPTSLSTLKMDPVGMKALGELFEYWIQQVSGLERARDKLIQELLALQEPMLQDVERLRGKLKEAKRLLTLAQLDYVAVHEEVQQVKRKLFTTARDCIQSQVTLAAQVYEVAQSGLTQEQLKASLHVLTHELSQLLDNHQNQLNSLRDQASKPRRSRTMSDVSQCRQASIRLQRMLSGSMMALEGWYEPRMVALLRRSQAGEEALRNCKGQVMDLKASLAPLRDDIRRLEVERSCLEKQITLMEIEREERMADHKETVEKLQETLRELKLEFEVQKNFRTNLEQLTEGLKTELTFLRGRDEPRNISEEEEQLFISRG
ncbi:keratin, type I cuticular Ha4-like [Girardinichthys multiradiatus]|uniref:keratin, type I cuticular Ha4-like n=1 Tax=Girardinichthys multiradiatus TaxID=208333 RepID=UPI001FAC8FC1|nr:keratin, type I cuticular Ha4-like [Girardinichthys multiradiatus]